MSGYYYLLSSLPSLAFEQAAPLSAMDFKEALARWLTPADMAIVESLGGPLPAAKTANGLVNVWNEREWGLHNALVRLRAQKLGREAGTSLHLEADWFDGETFSIQENARQAMTAANPLEAELILDRARWQLLDELEIGHHFDLEQVVIYALKLAMCERRGRLNLVAGQEKYAAAYNVVAQSIPLDLE
jgi:hypothetical protein